MALPETIQRVQDEFDADVVALYGPFERGVTDNRLITQCRKRRRRKNVFLLLESLGGDPGAAYRIARCFQDAYGTKKSGEEQGRFYVAVGSYCKSAGTLLCLGASRLYMEADAELGPIDIQLRKPDEVGERTSGLTPMQALDTLKTQSLSLFKHHFRQLRFDEELVFSTKAAAEVATNLTVGLMGPVYSQIDPIRLAEVERAIRISGDYAERIAVNLKQDGLARLLGRYPSHGFVIDKLEAADIFTELQDLPESVKDLIEDLKFLSDRYAGGDYGPFVVYISNEPAAPEQQPQPEQQEPGGEGGTAAGSGGEEVRGPVGTGDTTTTS